MRKVVIGAIAGAVALVVAAVAVAATQQVYTQTFTTTKPGASTGTKFSTSASDPQNSANNNQPTATRETDIIFPKGTAVDPTAVPTCTATDNDLVQSGGTACKSSTKVGTGQAQALLPFNNTPPINAKVTAFNGPKVLILYVDPSPTSQPFVLRAKLAGNLKKSPKILTPVPPQCVPPATNQGGTCKKSDGSPGQEAILSSFKLNTVPRKKGKKVYIRTPTKCPKSKNWVYKATFKYADGTSKTFSANSKCK